MTALMTAAVVSTAGSLYQANKADQAGRDAQGIITDAEGRAVSEQDDQYAQIRDDWQDWRDTGTNALMQLNDPQSHFETSPGYQFRMDEGLRNTENLFSVKGGGGNAMRALNDYSQGMASGEYGNWWNQQMGRANLGTQGTAYTQNAGMNAANQNTNSIWRSAEDRTGIGLYSANQQASHMSDAIGTLVGGIKQAPGIMGSSGGGTGDNSFVGMNDPNYEWQIPEYTPNYNDWGVT